MCMNVVAAACFPAIVLTIHDEVMVVAVLVVVVAIVAATITVDCHAYCYP